MHVTTTLFFSLPQFSSYILPAAVITKQYLPKLKQSVGMSLTVLLDIALACRFQLYSEMCHEKGNKEICQSAMERA